MTQPVADRRARSGHANPFVILLVVLSATFVQLLDISIVNVAIPSIQRELHATYGQVQLVLVLYQLGFACTLITGARLGDIYGRRRLFIIGMAGFTIASAICGAAPSPVVLILGRLVQGVFSGMMFPQVLSVIQVTFAPRDRGRAFGIFGATIGLATIAGPLVGGSLIQLNIAGLDWRLIFYVNLPIGIAALFGAWTLLNESTSPDAPRLDIPGVLLITIALLLLVFPVTEGRDRGWPWWIFVLLAASVPMFALFALYERRRTARNRSPLIVMSLFSDRAFRSGLVLSAVFFAGIPAFFFTFSVYLQVGQGFSALDAGLTTFPFAFGSALGSTLSDRFAQRLGRGVLVVGVCMLLAGMVGVWLAVTTTGAHPHRYDFAGPFLVCGIGLGFFIAPVVNLILAGIHAEGAGSASGVLSTAQQIGGATGVAVIGVILFGLVGFHAGSAVADVRPELNRHLVALGVPTDVRSHIDTAFARCFTDRANANDPTSTPPSCAAAQRTLAATQLSPAISRGISALVGPNGSVTRTAIARDFSRAYRETVLYELFIFLAALAIVPLLPRPTRTQLPPPAAAA